MRGHDSRRGCGRQRREPPERSADRWGERESRQQRGVAQPRDGPHDEPHPPEGDVHERSHESRVELCSCTASDLCPPFRGSPRFLVRASRGDHVEDIRDRHDPTRERDLVAGESSRVTLAVPTFVVVADGLRPVAEPVVERLHHRLARQRMLPQLLPFLVRRLARLVEDLRAHLQFPDVVEQGRPVEAIEVVSGQPDLPAEAVRVGAYALRMPAGDRIVDVQRGDELEQDLGRFLGTRRLACCPHQMQSLLERLDRAGAQREAEPRRRFVGEDE